MTKKEQTQAKSKNSASSSHLGRNPFGKNGKAHSDETAPIAEATRACPVTQTLDWFLIDLPAESFLFALKTVLFVKGVFEKAK